MYIHYYKFAYNGVRSLIFLVLINSFNSGRLAVVVVVVVDLLRVAHTLPSNSVTHSVAAVYRLTVSRQCAANCDSGSGTIIINST